MKRDFSKSALLTFALDYSLLQKASLCIVASPGSSHLMPVASPHTSPLGYDNRISLQALTNACGRQRYPQLKAIAVKET